MFRNILFDFDGTLIDSNEIILNALNETARHFTGKTLDHEEMQSILGKPLAVQMKAIDESQWEAMDAFYRHYYRAHRDELTQTFDGIYEMLQELKEAGFKMGIVSNKGSSGIAHGLEKFGLTSFFDAVVSMDDVVQKKPHAECVEKALAHMNGRLSETLIVGDSVHDIECGKNAGIPSVLVGWTIIDRHRIIGMKPDFIAESPDEIVAIAKGKQ